MKLVIGCIIMYVGLYTYVHVFYNNYFLSFSWTDTLTLLTCTSPMVSM